jgi:hypothetical protein
VDSSAIANLNFDIRTGASGGTLVATAANEPAGWIELVEDLTLDAPATYFVRVFESNQPIESQLYFLQLSAISVCPPPPGALLYSPCTGDLDCDDADPCTSDVCDQECCVYSPRLYGDSNKDGLRNIADVACAARVIFQDVTFCGDHEISLDEIDIAPSAACGDDQLNIVDVLATALAAFQDARDECCGE